MSKSEEEIILENELLDQENEDTSKKKIGATPIWIISILLHCIVIAALAYIVVEAAKKKEDVIITTQVMAEVEEPLDEKKEVALVKEKADVIVDTDSVLPPQITTEEVAEHNETENNNDKQTAEGTQEGISDSPQVGSGLMGNIGGGGGGGGSFGTRSGGGRKRAVMKGGGSKATESAVDWALKWLADHQEKDGHWDSGKYEGGGTPEVDTAATGSGLLAFLGAGHTDRAGKYKNTVKTAVTWLIAAQRPDGSWDKRNYSNGICTMAMAEAAGMGCGGSEVKKSAELAVDYLLKQQNESGCFNYEISKRNDMSVTGWCIMGLKSALLSGIKEKEIKEAFHKCGNFFDTLKNTTGDNTSTTKGNGWYSDGEKGGTAGSACQAIAMLVRQYLGWERSAPWLVAAADGQVSVIPKAYTGADVYRIYYSFLTLFQQGGKHWIAWNEPVSKMIVEAQRQDGDFKGSWDKTGNHLQPGGRVMYTAFLCLSLEIYYRYKTVMK
jgi:hypothetical protein